MADKTGIEWTDATWNPIRGCSLVSEGCRNCYAMHVAHRFSGAGQPYEGLITSTSQGPKWNGQVKLVPEVLQQPINWARPRRIFVNSMSDLFHEAIPFEYIASVFAVMEVTTRHTYQVLTKRPQRMLEFFKWVEEFESLWPGDRFHEHWPAHIPWKASRNGRGGYDNCGPAYPPRNVWIGVSIEDQKTADERIPLLLQTPAAVRWISAEPLLGPISFEGMWVPHHNPAWHENMLERVDWMVVGGESGNNARPMHPNWLRDLRDQCAEIGVPFFFKQWGEYGDLTKEPPGSDLRKAATEALVFTSDGQVLGAGNRHGGMVETDWEEKGGAWMGKVGKKAAGDLLDGVEHHAYPEAKA